MKQISLSKGMFALVDDADFDWLNQWKWTYLSRGYAVRTIQHPDKPRGKRKMLLMHREILKPRDGFVPDHIDGNTLNNQRSNLREATRQQNAMNSKRRSDSTTKYRGVYWDKVKNNWKSAIYINGRNVFLGNHEQEEDAATAYNLMAAIIHEDFAKYNGVAA